MRVGATVSVPGKKKPIFGILPGCCARAPSGHATAAPPISVTLKDCRATFRAWPLSPTGSPLADMVCLIAPAANRDRRHAAIQTIQERPHMKPEQHGEEAWYGVHFPVTWVAAGRVAPTLSAKERLGDTACPRASKNIAESRLQSCGHTSWARNFAALVSRRRI